MRTPLHDRARAAGIRCRWDGDAVHLLVPKTSQAQAVADALRQSSAELVAEARVLALARFDALVRLDARERKAGR
jgi:hypothetical protein